jgi:Xaa-Pro aminopeptidase
MLTPILSRQRQKKLLDVMGRRKYGAVVIGAPHHVYYFTAHWTGWQHLSAFVLFDDGRSLLITANEPNKGAAADDVRAYEANSRGTLKDDQTWVIGKMITDALRHRDVTRIGADASVVTSQVTLGFDGPREQIDEDLFQIRRVKDPDELELMQKAILCSARMHERAREIIEPGLAETRMFAEVQAAAVMEAGEPLTALLGNDYACGERGGPPRKDRVARAGELYILDVGPVYRGYFSDNARTLSVDKNPTDEQYEAYEILVGCLALVESNAKAGTSCHHLWQWVNEYLKERGRPELPHHLGHGVGLNPHEFPHLNPDWDDTLLEGEVFSAEPAIYGPELNAGIRLENQYRVTKDGAVNLTRFIPLGLGGPLREIEE